MNMTYNIHPLFVHFPIAFLVVYSVIKFLPVEKWITSISWRPIQRLLLVVGVLGAFVSNTTGEMAEHLVKADHDLVEMHAFFAGASTWIYGILLMGEILFLLNRYFVTKNIQTPINKILISIEKIINQNILSKTLALFGLIAISITGLLGGVIVYGVSADPIAPFVLRLLGL
ncbi:MAG: hypothetical protein QG594_1027 [Bacteroidota bacterium]|nr:hypothetical protein [Bacteroidota bacterium]